MSAIIEEDVVIVETKGAVAEMCINRPKALNALNSDVLQSIIQSLDRIRKAGKARVITIRGAGEKAFVAGADIHQMNALGVRAMAEYIELGQRAMRMIETFEIPVIAAVQGYALGGGLELALSCDIVFASPRAKFGQPEVNLGIIPGFGGTQRLAARCGHGFARYLVLSGEIIDADSALRTGIVDKIVSEVESTEGSERTSGALYAEVQQLAETIASKGPLAVQAAKRVMRYGCEQSMLAGLRREVEAFLELFPTVDREEGMTAFLQKRPAQFRGR